MKIVLLTKVFLIIFHTATSTNTSTTGQLLDESILQLQQNVQRLTNSTKELENEYNTLKNDIIALRKLHGPCEPCKASSHDKNMCDCTEIKPKKDLSLIHI